GRLDFLLASQTAGFWLLADGHIQRWRSNHVDQDLGTYPWDVNTTRVSAACEDHQGNLLVGTLGAGLLWFGNDGKSPHLSKSEGLSYNHISSLQVDREGNLWVGTDGGGLNRVKQQAFESLPASPGWVVQSVSEDSKGGLWIGANSGGVSYWQNGVMQRFL